VLPKASFASERGTYEQAERHGYFERENEVGMGRGGRK
jgi:hypothetical protein